MGFACPLMPSPTVASAMRATRAHSAISLPNHLTPAATSPVSMATATSPQVASPPVSAMMAIPEPSVTKVGTEEVGVQGKQPYATTPG